MLELLKAQGIEEDKAAAIVAAMKGSKIYTTNLENIDVRYNKLKEQHDEATKTIEANKVKLTELEGHGTKVEELTKEISNLRYEHTMEKELDSFKCKNAKAVKALLDNSSIKFEDGKIEGLKEQLEALKASDSYLFDIEQPPVHTGSPGNHIRGTKTPKGGSKQWKDMSLAEKANLYKEDREKYDLLKGEAQ